MQGRQREAQVLGEPLRDVQGAGAGMHAETPAGTGGEADRAVAATTPRLPPRARKQQSSSSSSSSSSSGSGQA